jgi:hypothetical protein
MFCAWQILNYWRKYNDIQEVTVIFKSVTSFKCGYYDYSSWVPETFLYHCQPDWHMNSTF